MDARCASRVGSGEIRRTLPGQRTILLAIGLGIAGCQTSGPPAAAYQPRSRAITITTIPLLTTEMQRVYPFLAEDFAPGGILEGQEVYAFMPSTIMVTQGDTVQFRFINPEDDVHSFVLPPDLSVALPGLKTTTATYVARQAGVFAFTCSIPAHLPSMWGQLVVLSPVAIGKAAGGTTADTTGGTR